MKTILKTWSSMALILRILLGIIVGVIVGLAAPQLHWFALFGSMFVGMLKAIAPILVFFLIVSALTNAGTGIGERFRTVLTLYMLSTLLAAVVAVVGSFLFPVTVTLNVAAATESAPGSLSEVLTNVLANMVVNPITAIVNGNYIGILFWSVLFGLALKQLAANSTRRMISDLSDMVSRVVRWIIELAPFGVMGLVFSVVADNGIGIFREYGKLLALLVGCMLLVALAVDPLLAALYLKRNPYPLVFRCLKDSGITAFFTRSSAANIPVNMTLCDSLGLDPDFYSVSIPLGATINMDGAAVTITVMTLAMANTLGISVSLPSALLLSVVATLAACGASGVAGGSLLLIPMACSLFGISADAAMEAVAIGFIIGVVQDSVETALNSSGDVLFAATAEFHDRMKRGERIRFYD